MIYYSKTLSRIHFAGEIKNYQVKREGKWNKRKRCHLKLIYGGLGFQLVLMDVTLWTKLLCIHSCQRCTNVSKENVSSNLVFSKMQIPLICRFHWCALWTFAFLLWRHANKFNFKWKKQIIISAKIITSLRRQKQQKRLTYDLMN